MAPTLKVYEPGNATPLGTLAVKRAKGEHQQQEDGSGEITLKGDVSAALLAENNYVRLNDGVSDVHAFRIGTPIRRQVESGSELILEGTGLKSFLHAAQIRQEDTSDCAEPARVRWFGAMSGDYDDSTWTAALSHGLFRSKPFVTVRPENWNDPLAQFIGPSTSAVAARTTHYRRQFNVAADIDVFLQAAADDEYRLFLDGTLIFDTFGGGAFQWRRYQQKAITLCAGTHTLYAEVRNLDRASAATNITWFLCSVLPANTTTGEPEASNQQWAVYHDHTGGTFTLGTWFGGETGAIAYNAPATDVQTALEGPLGAGNVTVTGTGAVGDPWVITMEGSLASTYVPLTADGTNLTGGTAIEVTEYVRGGFADAVVRTDTDWVMLDNPASPPGLTPGEIFRIVHLEAKARGATVLDHMTRGFTTTLDSDGNAWAAEITLPVSLPSDIHRLAVIIEQLGYAFDIDPDLSWRCWNDRGSDVSGTVTWTAGTTGVTDIEAWEDRTVVKNVWWAYTDSGWYNDTDTASVTARGRWEDGDLLDGFADDDAAAQYIDQQKAQDATPQKRTRLTVGDICAQVPYQDAGMGDVVAASAFGTSGFVTTDMRVWKLTWILVESSLDWIVELVD